MTPDPTGGPAFPSKQSHEHFKFQETVHLGMTLRDYLAAKAMAAYVSIPGSAAFHDPAKAAEWAYTNADAMLKERDKHDT